MLRLHAPACGLAAFAAALVRALALALIVRALLALVVRLLAIMACECQLKGWCTAALLALAMLRLHAPACGLAAFAAGAFAALALAHRCRLRGSLRRACAGQASRAPGTKIWEVSRHMASASQTDDAPRRPTNNLARERTTRPTWRASAPIISNLLARKHVKQSHVPITIWRASAPRDLPGAQARR